MSLLCRVALCLVAALAIAASAAHAHSFSQASLQLSFSGDVASAQWRISLRDLDALLGLDADHDQKVSNEELAQNDVALSSYLLDRLELHADGAACVLEPLRSAAVSGYLHFDFGARCPAAPQHIAVRYDLFFDHDPTHTSQVIIGPATVVVRADARVVELALGSTNVWQQTLAYLEQGVWHIWTGYDHILFLCTLLLPAMTMRSRASLLEILKIVSAFTLAHSITLSLAALGVVALPSRWVEATIAASVCWAALNNLYQWVTRRIWLVVFAFGLVHGFGFASVLHELGLPSSHLLPALVAFNAGVELGQLAIVIGVLPLGYALQRFRWYTSLVLHGGSLAIAAVGGMWLCERALDMTCARALTLLTGSSLPAQAPLLTAAVGVLVLFAFAGLAVRLARWTWLAPLLACVLLGVAATYTVSAVKAGEITLHSELSELLRAAQVAGEQRAWRRAAELLEQASQVADTLDSAQASSDVWRRIGAVQVARADLPAAQAAYERALGTSQEAGDLRGSADAERELGLVAKLSGDRALAMRRYRHALAAHERLGLTSHAANDTADLAALYLEAKLYSDAEAMYTRALTLQHDEAQVARLSTELGMLHMRRATPDAAAQWFERAATLHERGSRPVDAANQYANLAQVRREQGQLAEASRLYIHSLELFRKHGQVARAGRVQRLLDEIEH